MHPAGLFVPFGLSPPQTMLQVFTSAVGTSI